MSATPALMIAGPASGQGKTSVTAALARFHARAGRRVHIFKTGPDFLDPMILARASGAPVYNLDLWMTGEADCRLRLARAASEADLILVEGVMGLYDGAPSSADLAQRFGLPVLVVIDGSAMAQTFGAIAQGLTSYRPDLSFAGVVANRIGGLAHGRMLRDSLPPTLQMWAALPHDAGLNLPERHLGLKQPSELPDLDARLDQWADAWSLHGVSPLPAAVDFALPTLQHFPPLLAGRKIAVARDAAFAFIYAANLDSLRELGADLCFFSPLADERLPDCDALWLPGGYPELHLARLSEQGAMRDSIRAHHAAHKPILAECGGLLWLLDSLTDSTGHRTPMLGLLRGDGHMQTRLSAIDLQEASLPEGRVRGHTFHYSRLVSKMRPVLRAKSPSGAQGEAIYRSGRLTASYMHFYFPSNPQAVARWFAA